MIDRGELVTSFVSKNEELFIGIDGGGTKCRAIISDAKGKIVGRGLGGPANPFFGVPRAIDSILNAANNAVIDAGLAVSELGNLVAGVGLAGVNLPGLYEELNSWKHPFSAMYLTTDMDIANIGAHGGGEGAVIIVGTGSCGYLNVGGVKAVFGGHGFPIGDKASGAWMGLKAIEHTLLILDGFKEEDVLANRVCHHYGVKSGFDLSEKLIGQSSQQYAEIASLIFECASQGDEFSKTIVNEGAEYIGMLVDHLTKDPSVELCLIGGLAKYYLPVLDSEVAKKISTTAQQPEMGAVYYAVQNSNKTSIKSA
jgi:glucosamine kinase